MIFFIEFLYCKFFHLNHLLIKRDVFSANKKKRACRFDEPSFLFTYGIVQGPQSYDSHC